MKDLKNLNPQSIIVRMPNWLGDLVMATPILIDLRNAFPKAEITAMCQENVAPLLEHDPVVDELFRFKRSKGMIRRIHERNVVAHLKQGRYDLGILLTNSFSSAWRFWKGNVKNTIGYRGDRRNFLLSHPILFPEKRKEQHLVLTYKELLAPLGIPVSETFPCLIVSEEEIKNGWEIVKRFDIPPDAKLIGINPGAAFGTAKCWFPERFREVAKNLVEADPRHVVLFFGDGSHKQLIGNICVDLPKRVINLAAKTTLREFLALIKICSVLLTNDSGPMHIADGLDVLLVALFSSTSLVATGPYRQSKNVIQKKVPCSPCFKRICPIDFPCMKKIGVEEVTEAVLKQMEDVYSHA
ncbi:MAG: lipopolysaccharide heptosyltransferase II [Candidatus Neptunochlamydia sp.]|nr:lipopolysaccharide heptosyltransferase II [Candidatus Neptunochlamydia sp.]